MYGRFVEVEVPGAVRALGRCGVFEPGAVDGLPGALGPSLVACAIRLVEVPTQASFVKKGRKYIISASGGVEISPLAVTNQQKQTETLSPTRAKAMPSDDTRPSYGGRSTP